MKEFIDVNSGQVKVGTKGTTLRSAAIGSCIVVAAYDSRKSIGAMAHIMLASSAPQQHPEKTKYASDALEEMLNQMFEAGSNADDIEVCLVGAVNVLENVDDTICEDNIKSVSTILAEKNIPVRASALGGTERRSVFLDVENGVVSCTEGDKKEKALWRAGPS